MTRFGILAEWDKDGVTLSDWCGGKRGEQLVFLDRAEADKECLEYNVAHHGLPGNLRYSVRRLEDA